MGRWGDGEMGRWGDGEMGRIFVLYKWGMILLMQVEWASCPLSIFVEWASCPLSIFPRFLYTSRFPIPDSRFPSSNRKPQLDSWGFFYGITFVKKVLQGKEVGAVVTENPEVARVSGQFIAANRPPTTEENDF
ncbi:MAG: hypothetical protein F6J90_04700 [Moorea sp. SIOASIH]|nr:hypothetical protein [Moorena sp. SIOASIH]